MKSAQQSLTAIQMMEELEVLEDTALLDRRIAQEGCPQIEGLSLFESEILEGALIRRFGPSYRKAVMERRKSRGE